MTRGPIARLAALMRGRPGGSPVPAAPSFAASGTPDPTRALARHAPPGSDWVWRPGAFAALAPSPAGSRIVPGQRLGDGLSLFHDCPALDLTLKVVDTDVGNDAPPRALAIEVGQFSGSYMSLVTDLPAPVARGLTRQHLIGVRAQLALSGPSEIYLRLNLRHGPNTDTQVRRASPGGTDGTVLQADFDLASIAFAPERMTAAWLDLIIGRPAGLRIELRDIVLSRRLRAAL